MKEPHWGTEEIIRGTNQRKNIEYERKNCRQVRNRKVRANMNMTDKKDGNKEKYFDTKEMKDGVRRGKWC